MSQEFRAAQNLLELASYTGRYYQELLAAGVPLEVACELVREWHRAALEYSGCNAHHMLISDKPAQSTVEAATPGTSMFTIVINGTPRVLQVQTRPSAADNIRLVSLMASTGVF